MNQDILENLNQEQKLAVTSLDGPLLIIAGAGTGKTKVITYRVAYLIKTIPGLRPSNILALTFSKKAAQEMLERVEDLIGVHQDEIWISTFHSFCHRILSDHAHTLNLPRNFKLLNRIEQWIFFREILPNLKLKYYLNLADPAYPIEGFLKFINRAKDELVLPADYEQHVKGLPQGDDKERQEEVSRVYRVYQEKCLQKGVMDFGDLIILTLELFSRQPDLLAKYQNQFRYILVDEFQDTNIAQIELISQLAAPDQNICVVGDDDQGIYRFRGASYASFIQFKERFPNLKDLSLTQNYRSSKNVLNLANRLIVFNLPDRYNPEKKLWSKNEQGEKATILNSDNYTFEAKGVLEKIKEIYQGLPGEERNFSNFAVLYRSHAHKDELIRIIKNEKIPYTVKGGLGLLEKEEIKNLISYLRVTVDPEDSVSLFHLLSNLDPGLDVDTSDLLKLNRLAKEKEISLFAILGNLENLHLKLQTKEQILDFLKQLNNLLILSQKATLADFFYNLLEKMIYPKFRVFSLDSLPPDKKDEFIAIIKFHRWLNGYTIRHPQAGLKEFVRYLSFYIEAGGELENEDWSFTEPEGIRLMTVHQAKGLEFPYVFVIGLVQNRFPARNRPELIPFPLGLIKEKLPQGNFHLQEERRLFYVAITRAQKKLFLSGITKPYHRPSQFLREVDRVSPDEPGDIEVIKLEYDSFEQEFNNRLGLEPSFKTYSPGSRPKKENYLPENFRLSFSQIDTYLACPLKYKYTYIYQIPTRPSPPLRFGSDIHRVLEEFYRQIKEKEVPSLNDLHQIYLKHWTADGYLDKMQEQAYQESGFKILKEFYNKNKSSFQPPLYIEEEFLLRIANHGLKGYIDRVDHLKDGTVEVIDYKTGKPKEQKYIRDNIQLDIYALACKEVFSLNPSVLSFYYLTTNEKISIQRSPEDLEKTKLLIEEVLAKIKEGFFEPQPGFRCRWCNYQILCPAYSKKG